MDYYMQYQGTEPGLMVRFEYPGQWKLYEERGKVETYRQVRMLGPRNHDDTYTAYFSVWGSPLKSSGGRHENLDGLVTHYKSHLLSETQMLSEQPLTVGGKRAVEVMVSYTMPPIHHKGLKAMAVPVKTLTVFLEYSPYLYELTYSADAREYEQSAKAFQRLLKTFHL